MNGMTLLGYALVALHGALLLWGVGGFLELLLETVPWKRFTNPLFPRPVLWLHWSAVTLGGGLFLYGYTTGWKATPNAMALAYAYMALVCAIETFGYLVSPNKYFNMLLTFIAFSFI